ncbi:MAG: ribosome small subunit-dependent GTPase A [Elusimicrobia bacterium GWC2_51_8]|nr:MAG: ribosome small subunit-dependent GTPase A [Elusimicrobia bacterium GWA2_51_34]OGR59999.1 MAG: ribosome small subunit-dependent GTPase A [Elusimicrobia bacterium GWC2_51_8]OGR86313.1 MAG: ribosome small subunit-dependent GTPase A [Elusimicrobia bacterium GWF2_52_66]HAF95176.1 ribosome small subunit-dependent GTPase A [Elusimicrobiota bacterium]HCE98396.1 ribosome small subunit-dependent GTPase A [Elusimicrobiota bacterium]
MKLEDLGWDDFFQKQFEAAGPGLIAARVTAEYAGCYEVSFAGGSALASISGRLRHTSASEGEMPVVGDWVLLSNKPAAQRLPIQSVLTRRSKLSRKASDGKKAEQTIAANADTIFVVQGLDKNYNPRRLERFLTAVRESGAAPAVILNKTDICDCVAERAADTALLAPGVPVIALDSVSRRGYELLTPFLAKGRTLAFIGSSGVGKSTIINNLTGNKKQKTAAVREKDSKGAHTTTTRRLIRLDGGALLIDTPGMKGFEAWNAPAGVKDGFKDIEELSLNCRFTNCGHETEPGCAVHKAMDSGALDRARCSNFLKIKKEAACRKAKTDQAGQIKRKTGFKRKSVE